MSHFSLHKYDPECNNESNHLYFIFFHIQLIFFQTVFQTCFDINLNQFDPSTQNTYIYSIAMQFNFGIFQPFLTFKYVLENVWTDLMCRHIQTKDHLH